MLETTRIRREGYASRPMFADFVKRYKILGFEARTNVNATGDSCRHILVKAGITGFEIGKTKVFMRYWHTDELNEKLRPYGAAASLIGVFCRGFAARSKFQKLLQIKREQDRKVEQFLNHLERGIQVSGGLGGLGFLKKRRISNEEEKNRKQKANEPDIIRGCTFACRGQAGNDQTEELETDSHATFRNGRNGRNNNKGLLIHQGRELKKS